MDDDAQSNRFEDPLICSSCGKTKVSPDSICCETGEFEPLDPLIGTVFAERYQIVSVLGRGGMSTVYKARHSLMDRMVAIKLLVASDVPSLKRFQLEAKLVSSLKHNNIVTVYDFGISPKGQPYLVMDYLEGITLDTVIGQLRFLPVHRALAIFCQACDALYYAHKRDVVHRDLKPSNFMLEEYEGDDVLKLVDFGIAKHLNVDVHTNKLTAPGMVMGSPIYMSPEQCLGKKLDQRSDIYALGCVMYECLTGKPPLVGETVLETLQKHIHEAPRSFASAGPEFISIPEQLEKIVLKCLEREPEKRYPTMLELWTDLELFQNSLKPLQLRTTQTDIQAMRMPASLRSDPGSYVAQNKSMVLVVVAIALLTGASILMYLRAHSPSDQVPQNEILWKSETEAGENLLAKANYREAAKAFKEACRAAETFDPEDPRLAESLTSLGNVYREENFYPEAERSLKRALALKESIFGKTSLPVGQTLTDLGSLYCTEDKVEPAEAVIKQALEITKANAGVDSIAYADCLKAQAALLNRMGEDKSALPLLQKALAIRTKALGSIDKSNVDTIIALATNYQKNGDLQKSTELYSQARRIVLRSYDNEHPFLADSLVGLASIALKEKRFEEAQKLFQDALVIREKTLGKNNVKTGEVLSCLGILMEAEGDDETAQSYLKEAFRVKQDALGPDDPEVARSAAAYASCLERLGVQDERSKSDKESAKVQ